MAKRTCAYCGLDRMDRKCRCRYRYMRMGNVAFSMENVSRESTIGEMRREFQERTKGMKEDAAIVWMFSVTGLSKEKMAKADAKRAAPPADKTK